MSAPEYPTDPTDPRILELDPLGIDHLLPSVWRANAAADANALVGMLRSIVPSEVAALSMRERVAAMRDLGWLAASIKRHGVEPVDAVPELEAPLLELGERTGMVPRDTILHYIGWNPPGPRERVYTGLRMERILSASVRTTVSRLDAAVEQCKRLVDAEPTDLEFALAANELVTMLRSLEDGMDIVIGNVTPEFFAQVIRPYLEAIRVGGQSYRGPAAAHVPLSLVDLALWASDCEGSNYEIFWRDAARYGLPSWRPLYSAWASAPSVVTRVAAALTRVDELTPYLRASAEAVCRALRALVVFRGKHLTIARKAYSEEVTLFAIGSGGATVELLTELTTLTRDNANALRASAGHGPVPTDDLAGDLCQDPVGTPA
jgi:monodechloroaminopyrrolnitrin synthase